jgi:hypothetical protein
VRLSQLQRPFTCLVVCEPTPRRCLDVVERYERVVDSFEINLAPLGDSGGADVFRSTSKPCIAAWRRSADMTRYGYSGLPRVSESSRAESLSLAVGQGAAAADLELDTFGVHRAARGPAQGIAGLSMDRDAVQKQQRLTRGLRSAGAEVVMSCHLRGVLKKQLAAKVTKEVDRRGGQFASMVSQTPQRHDVFAMLAAAFALGRETTMPFAVTGVGAGSGSDALLSLLAGSSWVYCRPESEHAYRGQPTVEEAVALIGSLGLKEV